MGTAALLAVAVAVYTVGWPWIKAFVTQDDTSICSTGMFEIEKPSARTDGGRIVVTSTVRNDNPIACGVQVSVAVKDKAGNQIAIEQIWVAGVGNIPAGATHSFPIYLSPEVSKQAESGDYDIKPISSRVWRQQ